MSNVRLRGQRSALAPSLVLITVLAAGATPGAAQTFSECLSEDGVVHVGGHSAAVAGSQGVSVFGGGVSGAILCGPPQGWSTSAQGDGYAGSASFQAAIGVALGTGAIAPPSTTLPSRGFMVLEGVYRFRIIPDDPLSTTPVDLDITTRHRFGQDMTSVSGAGSASNSYRATYAIEPVPTSYSSFTPDWTSDGAPIVSDGYFDLVETVTVPVNQDLAFRTHFEQQSFARSGSPPGSSAAASLTSFSTFEFETGAAATILFAFEDALGVGPPQLDVVPEPTLVATLAPSLALLTVLARRRIARDRLA